jgi:hypothetical protein
MGVPDQKATEWLLESDEPGIRLQARRDLLGEDITWTAADILTGPWASALLSEQAPDGGFGVHPYGKWWGAHWRLVSLIHLGLPAGEPNAIAAAQTVLDWLTGSHHRAGIRVIKGLTRRCGSQEGNALAVCSRLGMAGDERVKQLADSLVGWQWPDGGWNCDTDPSAHHSSFNESLPPVWGLTEYARATGDDPARNAAHAASEFFLEHGMFKSHRTGEVGYERWVKPVYPHYWHYDVLYGLTTLWRAGALPDRRAVDALALIRSLQGEDGRWRNRRAAYVRGSGRLYRDPANWERSGPSQMLTLNALRVLKSGGEQLS